MLYGVYWNLCNAVTNGKNIHKVLGSPVRLLSDSSSNISVQLKQGQFLRKIDVFIWDEAAMAMLRSRNNE